MTDNHDLSSLLHDRAERADLAQLDAQALMRQGETVVRRRRTAMIVGVAALAIIATATVTQLAHPGIAAPDPAVAPTQAVNIAAERPDVQVWSVGGTLAIGGETFDLGRPVGGQIVLTSAGFLFDSFDQNLWAVDADGTDVRRVDGTAVGPVVSDQDGVLAAWIDESDADDRTGPTTLSVIDLTTDEVTTYPLPPVLVPDRFELLDLEADTAYVDLGGSIVSLDLKSGDVVELGDDVEDVVDVEADTQVIVLSEASEASGASTYVARTPSGDVDLGFVEDSGVLSPNGGWYGVSDAFREGPVAIDTATGRRTRLDLTALPAGYGDTTAVGWLDDTTVSVVARSEDPSKDQLLTCQVPSGSCVVSIEDPLAVDRDTPFAKFYPGGGF